MSLASIFFKDFIIKNWELMDGVRRRTLEFKTDINGIIGSKVCSSLEIQVSI